MLFGFGSLANFFIYQAFFTGIYNYRQRELANMRRIGFPFKIGMSSMISGIMCYKLYNDNLYHEDIYKVACKYRQDFDEKYKNNKSIEKEGIQFQ